LATSRTTWVVVGDVVDDAGGRSRGRWHVVGVGDDVGEHWGVTWHVGDVADDMGGCWRGRWYVVGVGDDVGGRWGVTWHVGNVGG